MRTASLIIAFVALATAVDVATAWAADSAPSLRAYVSETTVTVGTRFMLTLEISGRAGSLPKMPDVEGLTISAQPNTQSTRMEFSSLTNLQVHRREYGYYAHATRPGKIIIPSIEVEVDGKPEHTEPIELTVLDAAVPARPSGSGPGQARQPRSPWSPPSASRQQPQSNEQVSLDEAVLIESSVDKRQVYQGEPIELTLSIWILNLPGFRAGNYRGQSLAFPDCEGFYATPLEEGSQVEGERDGRSYKVITYRRTLYPTVSGSLQIAEWHWAGGAVYGFESWNIERVAPAIPIQVVALPERPPNFSGAVGHFTIEARLARDEAVQGVPMQLVVVIRGRGNPDAIGEPKIPQVENAYISDPDREAVPAAAAGADIEKTFVYTITPLEAGELRIPPIEFCYFEPAAATYKTEATPPLTLRVLRSAESTGPRQLITQNDSQEPAGAVSMLADDIFPLAAAPGALLPVRSSGAAGPVAAVVPVVAYAGVALFMRRKRRFERNPAYARAYRARARALKRLQAAATQTEPAEGLYKAVIGYVADRFNAQETGLTSQEVAQLLEANSADAEVRDHIRKILRACERTRYGGAKLSKDEVDALARAAGEAIDRLEIPREEGHS